MVRDGIALGCSPRPEFLRDYQHDLLRSLLPACLRLRPCSRHPTGTRHPQERRLGDKQHETLLLDTSHAGFLPFRRRHGTVAGRPGQCRAGRHAVGCNHRVIEAIRCPSKRSCRLLHCLIVPSRHTAPAGVAWTPWMPGSRPGMTECLGRRGAMTPPGRSGNRPGGAPIAIDTAGYRMVFCGDER